VVKPISLPNGRFWTKKGDAERHFGAVLAKHQVGQRVTDESDHSDLASLLELYDADLPEDAPTKAGTGVDYFEKGVDSDHPGRTTCFFVVRSDGSRVDFSLGKALASAAKLKNRKTSID
jgi:hypothetical protein